MMKIEMRIIANTAIPMMSHGRYSVIMPLFFIIGVAYFGKSSKTLEAWRKKHRGIMRLVTGLFLIALGIGMLYYIL